jgi:branched-chain amino acid transport system permease protein
VTARWLPPWPLTAVCGAAAAWCLLARVLPRGLPPGIMFEGLIYGALYSLSAVGVVLIYRSSRVVNFAQAQLGLLAGVTTALLVAGHGWNFYLAIAIGLLIAALTGALTHMLVIHRLRNSSRVLVAVATIGLAQAVAGVVGFLPSWLCSPSWLGSCSLTGSFSFPLNVGFSIYPVDFTGNDVVVLVVSGAVLGALGLVLRRTFWGQSMRAAAENRDRAVLLGLRVFPLDMSVWILASVLSSVTIFLHVGVFGYSGLSSVPDSGDDILLRVLAAAVIGGMDNIPRTVAAALALGVYDAGATWTSANVPFVDATLVVVIVVALLFQHRRFSRRGEGSANWLTVAQFKPLPPVLARLPEVRVLRWAGAGAVTALALVLPDLLPLNRLYLMAPLLLYGVVGLSLVVLSGWAGQISLGQFGLSGLAGAVAGYCYEMKGWNFLLGLVLGTLGAAAAAFVIGLPALRIRGPFLGVTTLAFALAVAEYVLPPQWFPGFIAQSLDRPRLGPWNPLASDAGMYYLCLAAFMAVALGLWWFRHSTAGRALIATRDNEVAAEAAGLATTRIRLTAFVLSGAIAGLAGVLFVVDQRGVFYGSFSADASVLLFSMSVVGGLGSLPGVVLGVVYIWGVQYLLPPQWSVLVSGTGILLLLLFLPEGLGGLAYRIRDALVLALARRRGLTDPGIVSPDVAGRDPELPPGDRPVEGVLGR